MGCTGLTSIVIPYDVTDTGNNAFYGCTRLTHVTIPDSVTFIGGNTFNNCTNLSDIYFSGTEERWAANTNGSSIQLHTNAKVHFTCIL